MMRVSEEATAERGGALWKARGMDARGGHDDDDDDAAHPGCVVRSPHPIPSPSPSRPVPVPVPSPGCRFFRADGQEGSRLTPRVRLLSSNVQVGRGRAVSPVSRRGAAARGPARHARAPPVVRHRARVVVGDGDGDGDGMRAGPERLRRRRRRLRRTARAGASAGRRRDARGPTSGALRDARAHAAAHPRAEHAERAAAIHVRAAAAALFTSGRVEVRSIHWSPYDRVGVVNADP
eukprot:29403-Pelagococcus_subviridis.AAC.6